MSATTARRHTQFSPPPAAQIIAKQQQFHATHTIENGPRFYMEKGHINKQPIIFKFCLQTKGNNKITQQKLLREILFLDYVQTKKIPILYLATPRLYHWGTGRNTWYMRQYRPGQPQNKINNLIDFKKTFFTQTNLRWLCSLFGKLQSLPSSQLPAPFRQQLTTPNFLKDLAIYYLRPHWQLLSHYTISHLRQRFWRQTHYYSQLYNTAPLVLAHQEPYATHFISARSHYHLIDWENINWANPARDFSIIWMRGYVYPAWQRDFFQKIIQAVPRQERFLELWNLELLMQSLFNILTYHYHPRRGGLVGLFKFSKTMINILAKQGFI